MNSDTIQSCLTSHEIAHLTETAHKFVLERACDALIAAGINPNQFWINECMTENGLAKGLYLPKRECLIAISSDSYADKARAEVLRLFETWERQE